MSSTKSPAIFSTAMLKGAAVLLSGTLAALLIAVGVSPILSRLYEPAEFGVFGMYLAITNIILVMSTARYENAILLPSLESHALVLRWLSVLIAVSLAIVIAAVLSVDAFLGGRIASSLGLGSLAWVIPLTALLLGLHQAMSSWWLRHAGYRRIGASRIARTGSAGGAQLVLGLQGLGAAGLIFGQAIGHASAAAILWSRSERGPRVPVPASRWRVKLLACARKYARFPKLELPQALLNSGSQQLPVFILTALYDPAVTGAYVMASRVLIMPITLMAQSLRQAMLRQAVLALKSPNAVFPSVWNGARLLFAVGVVPALVLMFFGRELFAFVLGKAWSHAGHYAALMAPWLLMLFVKESVLGLVPALKLQRVTLTFEVWGLPLRALALVGGAYVGGAEYAIGFVSAFGAISNLALIILLLRGVKSRDRAVATEQERFSR